MNRGPARISLNRLRWYTIVFPIAFLIAVQAIGMLVLMPDVGRIYGHIWSVAAVSAGVVVFSTVVFRLVDGMQRRIVRQNEELTALNAVSTAVSGSLQLEEAARRALENAVQVTGAVAGEIVVEGRAPDEEPFRLSLGETAELEEISDICDDEHLHEDPAVAGVRIVRLDGAEGTGGKNGAGSDPDARTLACVPIRAQGRTAGVMRLLAAEPSHLSAEGSERLLAAMGNQIAVAVQAGRLFRDVLRRAREAQALHQIGLNIASMRDIQDILDSIVDEARETLGSEAAALCLALGNGDGVALASFSGPEEAFLTSSVRLTPLPAKFEQTGDSSGCLARTQCQTLAQPYQACRLAAPLAIGDSVIGELCVSGREPRSFSDRHRKLMGGLADMAAIAINNARLLEGERHTAVLEERQRLAREMHDSLAQVLGYVHLKAQVTSRALARDDIAKAREELDNITSLSHEAYVDVREAILGLRETVSPAAGIIGTLREYAQKFSRQTGIHTDVEVLGDAVTNLPPEAEVQLLRVIQEAMTNIRKHADAEMAWIRISPQLDGLIISVEDSGSGFDLRKLEQGEGRRFGLQVMRERVERIGGKLEIETSPGQGTKVRVHFSQRERETDDDTDTSQNSPGR